MARADADALRTPAARAAPAARDQGREGNPAWHVLRAPRRLHPLPRRRRRPPRRPEEARRLGLRPLPAGDARRAAQAASTKPSCARAARRRLSARSRRDRLPALRATHHFDALETRSADEREAALWRALPAQIAHARARRAGVRRAAARRRCRAAIDVARRARRAAGDAQARPARAPEAPRDRAGPVRRLRGHRLGRVARRRDARCACSRRPGRSTSPKAARADYWRMARALFAAGFRAGDLVHNSFSYHLTPAGSMMESGAHALGCTVFPGRHRQDRAAAAGDGRAARRRPTPARRASCASCSRRPTRPASRCRRCAKALVSGEALPPRCATGSAQRGIAAYQCYGTADLGLVAYETDGARGPGARRRRASSRSCAPAPAIRSPTARSARSS